MAEQTNEKSGLDGRIGRLTAIIVALTALIGALFALITTFSSGISTISHGQTGSGGASSSSTQPGPGASTAPPLVAGPAKVVGSCLVGFVWREATPSDHVCVVPDTRKQVAEDNRAARSRISLTDHSSGPDTCLPGYVWRETTASDHVCVTPDIRKQTDADNRAASSRIAP
jgi:hypothetical protein